MHLYAYGDWELRRETQTSAESAVASGPLADDMIILLDEDDEKEYANVPLLERPKICLPKRSKNTTRQVDQRVDSAVEQDNMDVHQSTHEEEIFQSLSCMPCLRDKSLEELRLECYLQSRVATGQSPKPASTPALAIPPSFTPWCQDGFDDGLGPEAMNNKRKLHPELDALASIQPTLTSTLTFGQVLIFN